jgi:hypothetical protein
VWHPYALSKSWLCLCGKLVHVGPLLHCVHTFKTMWRRLLLIRHWIFSAAP